MKHYLPVLVLVTLFISNCSRPISTENQSKSSLRLAFYNVENLFDTIDDPEKKDEEFTPESKKAHNTDKYTRKRANIIQVLEAIEADAFGLCEVENAEVVNDLIRNSKALQKKKMRLLHFESPDQRGIDNALIFSEKKFKVIDSFPVKVDLGKDSRPTRDILAVVLKSKNDTFCIYVNHWPSRSGGKEKSEGKRMIAGKTLSETIVKQKAKYPNAHHIALGDLNDHPTDKSVYESLGAKETLNAELINLMYDEHQSGKGSHAYRGEWGVLDHIIISKSLLGKVDTNFIFSKNWMLYYNKQANDSFPGRFYGRDKCYGGYSDHLPVVVDLN